MSTRQSTITFLAILLFAMPIASQGVEFWIAPDGDDQAEGTLQRPFATLERARDQIRKLHAARIWPKEGYTVWLKGGLYRRTSTFELTAEDSGSQASPVVYQAVPGDKPVISGGREVTNWVLSDPAKNIWKASVPGLQTRQLFVNGTRAVRARLGEPPKGWVQTATGFTTPDNQMAAWRNVSDIELIFNHHLYGRGTEFTERRCGIESIADRDIKMKQPCWGTISWLPPIGVITELGNYHLDRLPCDIENAYELLGQPGQWYLDRKAGELFYIPRPGEKMGEASVIAPVLETLVAAKSAPDVLPRNAGAPRSTFAEKPDDWGNRIHDVAFRGITFAHTTWMLPSTREGLPEYQANAYWFGDAGDDPEGSEAGRRGEVGPSVSVAARATTYDDHTGFAASAVSILGARNVRIERCRFTQLGGAGLAISGGSQDCAVEGCVLTDISDNGIRVGQVRYPCHPEPRMLDRRITIANCYIRNVACEYRGGVGIMSGYAAELRVLHNEISDIPYSGMSIGWGWGRVSTFAGNNEVAYNDVHDYCKFLSDGGGIYMTDLHSTIHHNHVHDCRGISGSLYGIYTDDGSGWITISSNVCQKLGGGGRVNWYVAWIATIHDMTIRDNYTDMVKVWLKGVRCSYEAPTVITNGQWPKAAQDIMAGAGLEPAYRDIIGKEDSGKSVKLEPCGAALPALVAAIPAAALKVTGVFSDHAVLQREMPVPVWGTAGPGATVTVEFAGQKKTTMADAKGNWSVKLDALPASAEPRDLKISDGKKPAVVLKDVLVGEVWVGSGQSNMDLVIDKCAAEDPLLAANAKGSYPLLRLHRKGAGMTWEAATPETSAKFSALLFSFGLSLQKQLNVPVGLLVGAVGGTPSGSWLSEEMYRTDAACAAAVKKFAATYDPAKAQAKYEEERKKYDQDMVKWKEEAEAAKKEGKPLPRGLRSPAVPVAPGESTAYRIGHFFEGYIRPYVGYGIRGVLWDQGEAGSAILGVEQEVLMAALIRGWRGAWGEGDFPFLYMQKPSGLGCAFDYTNPITEKAYRFAALPAQVPLPASGDYKPETYLKLMRNPNTFMVTSTDLGPGTHPTNKSGYGARGAMVAMNTVYGGMAEYYGPMYAGHEIQGGTVIVKFTHVGQGLVFKNGQRLQGFAIAGADGKFVWGDATIEGDRVIVSSKAVAKPAAVRYAWSAVFPWANLFNKDGLPAQPFSTDDILTFP